MERYKEVRVIGRGNYGMAYLVREKDSGRKLVVKKIPLGALSEKERETAFAESKLLARISHSNIIEFVTSFLEGDVLHIVTAFCDGGDLAALIKARREPAKQFLDEDVVLDIFIQLAMAVDYCHSLRIMHRDLKTGNVFISKRNVVKLGDFGIAKVLDTELKQTQTVVGTPHFMSPEVCESKPYDFKSDVWALGCILYELCALEHAFDAQNVLKLVSNIVQCEPAPLPDQYSEELKELVKMLLSKDPAKRPSVRKLFLIPIIKSKLEKLAERKTLPELPVMAPSLSPLMPGSATATATTITDTGTSGGISPPLPSPSQPTHRREGSLLRQSHANRLTQQHVIVDTPPLPPPTLKRSASHGESLAAAMASAMAGGSSLPPMSPQLSQSPATLTTKSSSSPAAAAAAAAASSSSKPPPEKKSNHHRSRSSIVFSTSTFENEFASSTPMPPSAAAAMRRESPPTNLTNSNLGGMSGLGPGPLLRRDSARSRSDSMGGFEDDGGHGDVMRVLDELKYRANLDHHATTPAGGGDDHHLARPHHARSNSGAFQQLSGTVSTTSTIMTNSSSSNNLVGTALAAAGAGAAGTAAPKRGSGGGGGHLRRASAGGELYGRVDSSSSLRNSRELLGDESL